MSVSFKDISEDSKRRFVKRLLSMGKNDVEVVYSAFGSTISVKDKEKVLDELRKEVKEESSKAE